MDRKKCRTALFLGAVAMTMLASAQELTTFLEDLAVADGRMAFYVKALADFRTTGMDKPDRAVEMYLSPAAQTKWRIMVARTLEASLMADFYTGAVPMHGPQSSVEGISALYNPWWDAVLVLRVNPIEADASALAHVSISEFHFLSGESFRGEVEEKNLEDVRYRTVVPDADPLSVEVWRVMSSTRKRFEEVFPIDGAVTYGALGTTLAMLDGSREMKRISVRGGLRLKFALMLLKDRSALGKSAVLANLVRTAGHYQLFTYFQDKDCFDMLRTLSEMPEVFRKDFIPYGYVPTEAGTQYLFVNRKVSRLYVTAAVPAGVGKDKPASLEWFDLAQADELLKTWETAKKEVSK